MKGVCTKTLRETQHREELRIYNLTITKRKSNIQHNSGAMAWNMGTRARTDNRGPVTRCNWQVGWGKEGDDVTTWARRGPKVTWGEGQRRRGEYTEEEKRKWVEWKRWKGWWRVGWWKRWGVTEEREMEGEEWRWVEGKMGEVVEGTLMNKFPRPARPSSYRSSRRTYMPDSHKSPQIRRAISFLTG